MVEKNSDLLIERLKRVQWGKLFHMFYIEPVVMVLIFSHAISGTIMRNQVIFQACTTIFNYNESICQQLGTKNASEYTNKIETEIQPYVANFFMTRTLLESIVPAICGVFIGSWSDFYGRKPLLLIAMIGFSFTYVISAIICELSFHMPVSPWYYIIAALPHSLLGGNCVFSVAAFCFISDVTDMKSRPYRMLFMEALFFIALTTGNLLSSFIYNATNSTTVFSISGILLCIATVFVALYVPETLHMKREEEPEKETTAKDENSKDIEKSNDIKLKETLKEVPLKLSEEMKEKQDTEKEADKNGEKSYKDVPLKLPEEMKEKQNIEKDDEKEEEKPKKVGLFSTVHIKDMFSTCLKPREYYDRSIIWLVTGVLFICIFIIDGAMSVVYLYVREKFHWSVRDFTFYETVSHSVPMVGALTGFLILRKVFKVSIVSLALLSFFSDIVASIVRGLASESWHLYLAVGLNVFRSISGPMCRTIVSNIVPPTDLGKIFSIKNILQSLAPFLAAPLYTYIYQKSLTTFPGLFFIVSAFLYTIAFILMFAVLILKYKCREHYAQLLK